MTPGEMERRIRDLESRLRAMEARPFAAGPQVSQLHGVTHVRPFQVGFAAEIRSSYDAATGYDWRQLVLESDATPTYVVPTDPPAGENAFCPDGNTSLTTGEIVWMEPDTQAGGWCAVKPGTASRLGWFARLTTSSGGRWKYYALTLSGGAWADDGAEAAAFTAVPAARNASLTYTPLTGDRVWMWTSKESPYQEFLPMTPWQMSVTADASGFKFVNDVASPGNTYYYGTDSGGTKGWYNLTETVQDILGLTVLDSWTVDFTYNDGAGTLTADVRYQMSITADSNGIRFVNDETSPGNWQFYKTNGAGDKGWHDGITPTSSSRSREGDVVIWDYSDARFVNLAQPLADGDYHLIMTLSGGAPLITWAAYP